MGWRGARGQADGKRKQIPEVKAGRNASARKLKKQPSSAHPDPEQEPDSPRRSAGRTGIVSVNGRDVERMHCRHS